MAAKHRATPSRISANDGSVAGRLKQASFDHLVCANSVCLFCTCRPSWQHDLHNALKSSGTPNFLITLASLKSPRLWQRSNNIFVSAPKPLIFIYINPGVLLALRTGAGGTFINNQFSNPEAAVRQCLRLFSTAAIPPEANRNGPSAGDATEAVLGMCRGG
jgi:hypothetical protein